MELREIPNSDLDCLDVILSLTNRDFTPPSEVLKGIYDYFKTYHLDLYVSVEDRATNPKGFIEKATQYLQNLEVTNE